MNMLRRIQSRLAGLFAPRAKGDRLPTRRLILVCVATFCLALGVRLLQWQDHSTENLHAETIATTLIDHYHHEARQMVSGRYLLFPPGPVDTSDARMIMHPPGYAILLAALYGSDSPSRDFTALRMLQIVFDSLSAVALALIVAELLPLTVAFLAGALAAASPHLAFYSLWLTPDAVPVTLILIATLLVVKAIKRPRLWPVLLAGLLLGASCWLRANGLMLAPFLAILLVLLGDKATRWKYTAALVATTYLLISPITLRNWVVYGRFIPLSLGQGITMVEGIADYDPENRFGMPEHDLAGARIDAVWHGRPDYAENLWTPDGIERDRYRFARGLEIVRQHPLWFAGVMLQRAAFIIRYNDFRPQNSSFNTTMAPTVLPGPPYGHSPTLAGETTPGWTAPPAEVLAGGEVAAQKAEVSVAEGGGALRIRGDDSAEGEQFASALISVRRHTDYILTIPIKAENGGAAVKIKAADPRITLARVGAPYVRKKKKRAAETAIPESEQPPVTMQIPFASGDLDQVRFVVMNSGPAAARPLIEVGQPALHEVGPTPQLWTRAPRAIIRGIQKNVYKTSVMRWLIALGLLTLVLALRYREALILVSVPIYYLSVQSILHTEYRYILAVHFFLFTFAAVTLYTGVRLLWESVQAASGRLRGRA